MRTESTRTRITLVAVSAGLIVSTVVGVSMAQDGPNRATPTSEQPLSGDPVSYVAATRSKTEPLAARDAEEQVLERVRDARMATTINAVNGPDGLTVEVGLPQVGENLTTSWHAELAAGAYAELVHTHERAFSELIHDVVAVGPNAEGVATRLPQGVGAARLGQLFNSPSDADLIARVHRVAEQFGLTVAEVRVLHPLESALETTLVVPNNARIGWTIGQLAAALEGEAPCVEGAFIRLVTPDGKGLITTTTAFRTGGGGLWFAHDQDDRFGAIHPHGPWL